MLLHHYELQLLLASLPSCAQELVASRLRLESELKSVLPELQLGEMG